MIVLIDNTFHDAPSIPLLDRGFLYGDSLYEVLRTYGGKLSEVEAHLARLERSCALCRLTLDPPLSAIEDQIHRVRDAFYVRAENTGKEMYLRLILTRGTARLPGFSEKTRASQNRLILIAQELHPPTIEAFEKGMSLRHVDRLRNSPRALDPAMKSGNYLNSVLAYLEAEAEGDDDAILSDADGFLTEGTTFNVGYFKHGILVTPPLDVGILDGITRRRLLEVARAQGIETREVRFPLERLLEADEVFVMSTVREIFPVTRLNGKKLRGPGPLTRKLAPILRARLSEGDVA
jgi:branched-chain amino acid aminotransferase